jgi:hypothetical protein
VNRICKHRIEPVPVQELRLRAGAVPVRFALDCSLQSGASAFLAPLEPMPLGGMCVWCLEDDQKPEVAYDLRAIGDDSPYPDGATYVGTMAHPGFPALHFFMRMLP